MEIPAIVGGGLIVIGVGIGIEASAEVLWKQLVQPDAYGKIQTAMLIGAALVEGIGFAAMFVL